MTGASIKRQLTVSRRRTCLNLPLLHWQDRGGLRARQSISLNFAVSLLLLSCYCSVFAQSAKPGPVVHATLKAASEAASADQSLVLLIFGAEWCGPCHKLKKETLASSDFLEKAGVIHLAEVDIDLDQKMAREFGIQAVPTLILLTPDGKIVTRREGFMPAGDLLAWIGEGRTRVKNGTWEGTAPGSKVKEFAAKGAGDGLTTEDLSRLVLVLGEADPAERAEAGKLLLKQQEAALPPLLDAVTNTYLGVRIAAAELLQQLVPKEAASLDPWQGPDELGQAVAVLRKWWADTGKLPAPGGEITLKDGGSVETMLVALRGDDPAKRTAAMSALVSMGSAVLGPVREAIKRADRAGDHRALGLLGDVLWAILIPDSIEQRTGAVRQALARGKGQERQVAATKLARAGRDAIPALAELASDNDALVVESAVRALSGIGGPDSVPAMAALLKANDSNLRMTAAQALGHTKNTEAFAPLQTVLTDSNEVVACAALAALEEIHSGSGGKELPAPIPGAIKACLKDPRWRVRAAAAEIAGKLKLGETAEELKALLDDPDSFVVKSALTALQEVGPAPDAAQLAALSKRLPGLRSETIKLMLHSHSDDSIKTIAQMYESSSNDEQVAILQALSAEEVDMDENRSDAGWKPLLSKAAASIDPRQRQATVALLQRRTPETTVEMLEPLLADEDAATRAEAADLLLALLANKRLINAGHGHTTLVDAGSWPGFRSSSKTNKTSLLTPERLGVWHAALLKNNSQIKDVRVASALFATGDGKTDLAALAGAFEKADAKSLKLLRESPAISVLVRRLPWPEGKPVVDVLCRSPWLFALVATGSDKAGAAGLADYVLEPARFKGAVESAVGDDLSASVGLLLAGGAGSTGWTLLSESPRTSPILLDLLDSTNAAWRAAAIYAMGHNGLEKRTEIFDRALKDTNSWVRVAAVQALARASSDRQFLEARLGPLLNGDDLIAAESAATALLESEVRQASGLQWHFDYFQFDQIFGGRSTSFGGNDDRPLTTLEGHPPFLDWAKKKLEAGTNTQQRITFAVLLSQYGDASGLDALLAQNPQSEGRGDTSLSDAIMAAIALLRDAKYIPFLQKTMEAEKNDWELRKILKALKGMSGPEARKLRLEVNKRMRASGTSGIVD